MSTRRAAPVLFCCAIIASAAYLVVAEDTQAVVTPQEVSEPEVIEVVREVAVSAPSYLVFDLETGAHLVAHNETQARPIASVTKLFTAATVLDSADLEAETTITWSDVATEGRAGKLEAGERYSVRELLWPLMLESSNDAATALERSVPDLLVAMNETVAALGAVHTHFTDASGLSAGNVSTAAELALLTRQLYQAQPHLFDIAQLDEYIGTQTGWVNNNPFATDEQYLGGKHGFTYEAGRTGVFVFEEVGKKIGYVVLGSDDLSADISALRSGSKLSK